MFFHQKNHRLFFGNIVLLRIYLFLFFCILHYCCGNAVGQKTKMSPFDILFSKYGDCHCIIFADVSSSYRNVLHSRYVSCYVYGIYCLPFVRTSTKTTILLCFYFRNNLFFLRTFFIQSALYCYFYGNGSIEYCMYYLYFCIS